MDPVDSSDAPRGGEGVEKAADEVQAGYEDSPAGDGSVVSSRSTAKETRGRWPSRGAFLLAAMGSAIGLGNLWRFPYLAYKWGGGTFFIPYLMSLFLVGIPLITAEMAAGQIFQGGHVTAMNRLHIRLRGIGFAAPFYGYMVDCYYVIILAWTLVYWFNSFKKESPWLPTDATINLCRSTAANATQTIDIVCETDPARALCVWDGHNCVADEANIAYSFFLGVINLPESPASPITLKGSGWTVLCAALAWICIYLSVSFGAKILGYIIYFTIGLPVILLIVMLIRGVTLPGAGAGVTAYIGKWDLAQLKKLPMWQEAMGQIFFSSSVCYGIMSAYASYNNKHQPLSQDAVIVACSNSFFSFVAGFVVFSVAGYLAHQTGGQVSDLHIASFGLAFVTFPLSFNGFGYPVAQIFNCLFFTMFFLLGLSSAFSLVEAPLTNMTDSKFLMNKKRVLVTTPMCLLAFAIGIPFSSNLGLFLLDTVDYYILNVGTILIGMAEAGGVGWFAAAECQIRRLGMNPLIAYNMTMWLSAWASVLLSLLVEFPIGLGAGIGVGILGFILSFVIGIVMVKQGDAPFKDEPASKIAWWFFLGNVEEVRHMFNREISGTWRKYRGELARDEDPNTTDELFPAGGYDHTVPPPQDGTTGQWIVSMLMFSHLTLLWSLLIKYFIPLAMMFIFTLGFTPTLTVGKYSGYSAAYQAFGLLIVCGATAVIVFAGFMPHVFDPFMPPARDTEASKSVGQRERDSIDDKPVREVSDAGGEVEMPVAN